MKPTPVAPIVAAAAGILLAAAVAGSGVARRPEDPVPQTITLTMHHSGFRPAHFTVRRGTTVRFVITNTDPIDHEFILGDEAIQRRHESGTEPAHGAIPGEVSVSGGGTAETTYTFPRSGLLLIGCHAPGHYGYGMRGWVRVVD